MRREEHPLVGQGGWQESCGAAEAGHRASGGREGSAVAQEAELRSGPPRAPACPVPQDPVLLSLSPRWGPQAGGTQLTIHGQHLQTGGNISAFVGSQPCRM